MNKMPDYFREYLDERFLAIDTKLDEIHACLYGNGHKGLVDKVGALENMKVYILGVFATIIIFGSLVGVYIRGFVEQIYQHLNQ